MKHSFISKLIIGLLGTGLAASALAFYPVDGWWYDPAEPGRGFLIEMQDDEMFIAAFHYLPSGRPIWWVANGRYDHNSGALICGHAQTETERAYPLPTCRSLPRRQLRNALGPPSRGTDRLLPRRQFKSLLPDLTLGRLFQLYQFGNHHVVIH
jgi:hypothetical protein